jgi:hypothetical protein
VGTADRTAAVSSVEGSQDWHAIRMSAPMAICKCHEMSNNSILIEADPEKSRWCESTGCFY